MTFDGLREQWRAANEQTFTPQLREQALVSACRRAETSRRVIVRRDSVETLLAILGIGYFGIAAISMESTVSRVGALLVVGSLSYIIYRLQRARSFARPTPLDISVRGYLAQEIAGVERQIELLRSVAWWYIIPTLTGCCLVYYGGAESFWGAVGYVLTAIVLGTLIYIANQSAVKADLVPLRDELQQVLDEFDLKASGGDQEFPQLSP